MQLHLGATPATTSQYDRTPTRWYFGVLGRLPRPCEKQATYKRIHTGLEKHAALPILGRSIQSVICAIRSTVSSTDQTSTRTIQYVLYRRQLGHKNTRLAKSDRVYLRLVVDAMDTDQADTSCLVLGLCTNSEHTWIRQMQQGRVSAVLLIHVSVCMVCPLKPT